MDQDQKHQKYDTPIESIRKSQELLVTWANRSTHGGKITPQEVLRMIDVCEEALKHFNQCPNCEKPIWYASTSKHSQCSCGTLRWVYQ